MDKKFDDSSSSLAFVSGVLKNTHIAPIFKQNKEQGACDKVKNVEVYQLGTRLKITIVTFSYISLIQHPAQ